MCLIINQYNLYNLYNLYSLNRKKIEYIIIQKKLLINLLIQKYNLY